MYTLFGVSLKLGLLQDVLYMVVMSTLPAYAQSFHVYIQCNLLNCFPISAPNLEEKCKELFLFDFSINIEWSLTTI